MTWTSLFQGQVSLARCDGKVCITLTYDLVAEQSILVSKVASPALNLL